MIRLLLAAGMSLTLSLLTTRAVINFLVRHQWGQPIREEGPEGHQVKAGTPTMGGVGIVTGAAVGYFLSDVVAGLIRGDESSVFTRTGVLVMGAIVGAGLVGFLDDWLKIRGERNLGLTKRTKTIGLLVVAVSYSVLMVVWTGVHTSIGFTRYDTPGIDLPAWTWVVWGVALIYGASNAVNLTDGLDGLAAGSGTLTFAAYVVIGFFAFRNAELYDLAHALDLAVVAAAMLGGCLGFLWFNAAPAQIFMGDTGSLAIGAGLAALALASSTEILLAIIGGLYVVETASVMLQVAWFKSTGGKRLFRMAPIHHHFELLGWPETRILIRFWMIAGMLTAIGLGLFYADFISLGGAS
ncbi:MAG: phospho-N-acetylmuramoyl-pentapeptide-transferase [Actinomycetia bacterium]|nr:phospho-N-acetylmuramoyl-pentapeptide-transferase [Actinomycetes bacterium]MCP4084250.1 phospho-N-acetylmuramoyl-pentapeptide-transferase [Actinomycetes bacterium]